MAEFDWIAPGAAQQDALTRLMMQRKVDERQKMLDSIAAQDRAAKAAQAAQENERANANLKIQQAQETRAQQGANAAAYMPGDEVTPEQAAGLNPNMVNAGKPAVAGTPAILATTSGFSAPGVDLPGVEGTAATPSSEATPDTFKGTTQERTAAKKTANEKAFGKFLNENPTVSRTAATAAALNYDIDPKDIDSLVDKMLPVPKPAEHSAVWKEWQDDVASKVDAAQATGSNPVGVMSFEQYQKWKANLKDKTESGSAIALDTSPEAMAHDVQDVLEGRQSLGQMRQTMGRTNAAAHYMERFRQEIHKQDPKFDFNLSEGGAKAVSSNYFQRSMSAINAVLPNLDKVAELSKDVPRLGIVGIDRILQKTAMQFGNTKVTNLHQARMILADEVGLALGQGTVSDMKLQLGFDITDPAVSDENFFKNIATLKQFVENRKDGLNQLRYHSATVPGSTATGDAPPATPTTPAGPKPRMFNPATGKLE